MDKITIEKYDKVSVHFHGAQTTLVHRGVVLYKPCATGDSWIIKNLDTNEIHYISEGCTITKEVKEE